MQWNKSKESYRNFGSNSWIELSYLYCGPHSYCASNWTSTRTSFWTYPLPSLVQRLPSNRSTFSFPLTNISILVHPTNNHSAVMQSSRSVEVRVTKPVSCYIMDPYAGPLCVAYEKTLLVSITVLCRRELHISSFNFVFDGLYISFVFDVLFISLQVVENMWPEWRRLHSVLRVSEYHGSRD